MSVDVETWGSLTKVIIEPLETMNTESDGWFTMLYMPCCPGTQMKWSN